MRTLKAGSVTTSEIEVKRSRFIALLARTDTEEEARRIIAETKITFPDARHHCSAYIVHPPDLNPLLHSSDDGEPAGTAGTPMLEVLRHSDMENVTAVVTRYFGGTLLGTGGLVRAYSQAVQDAIACAPLVEIASYTRFRADIPLAHAGRVEGDLRNSGWNVVDTFWGENLQIDIAALAEDEISLNSQLATLTRSSLSFHKVGIIQFEVDIDLNSA